MAFTTTNLGEMAGYPKSTWDRGHFQGVRKILVPWEYRACLIAELNSESGGIWPYADGPKDAICRKVAIEPAGPDNAVGQIRDDTRDIYNEWTTLPTDIAQYDQAIVTAWYSTRGPIWWGGNLYNEYLEPNIISHKSNVALLNWKNPEESLYPYTPLASDEDPGRSISTCTLVREWPQVVVDPATSYLPEWVLGLVDCININTFVAPLLNISFPPETLLYGMPEITRRVDIGKLIVYSVKVFLRYHPPNRWWVGTVWGESPASWNWAWRAETQMYEPIYLSDGTLYERYFRRWF